MDSFLRYYIMRKEFVNELLKKFNCMSLLASRHCLQFRKHFPSKVFPRRSAHIHSLCMCSPVFHTHVKLKALTESPLTSCNLQARSQDLYVCVCVWGGGGGCVSQEPGPNN